MANFIASFPNFVWINIVGFPPTPDQKGINSNPLLEHPAVPTRFSKKRKISMGTLIALNSFVIFFSKLQKSLTLTMGRPFPSKTSQTSLSGLTQFSCLPQFKWIIHRKSKAILNLYRMSSITTNEIAGSIISVGSVRMR